MRSGFLRDGFTRIIPIERGFSMIELMVALFVTTLGTLAVLSLIVSSQGAASRAADQVTAVNAARQEIEIIRGISSQRLTNRTDAPLIGSVPQLQNLTGGHGYLTISDYPSLPGVKLLTVRVTWTTRPSSSTKTYTATTLAAPNGIGL